MKGQSFIKGAVIVSVGSIAAKILGAFYRIPLTNLLGGEGMGVYQMVFPLYCLLLTVSATGIPSGLARMVSCRMARGESAAAVLRRAIWLFARIGAAGSAAMFLLAPAVSAAQGILPAANAYRMLAPGVFLVSVVSCFRGWFQGRSNFIPTAASELVEQVFKTAFGLFFAQVYRGDVYRAVSFTLLAVTISEGAAVVFLAVCARGSAERRPLFRERLFDPGVGELLRVTLPVAVAAGVLPLSNFVDSVLIARLVGRYAENVTALYGLFAGAATTLVNLPVSICYGLAAASVPAVSALSAAGDRAEAERRIRFALKCTLFLSVPAAAFLFAFPAQTASFLFASVQGSEAETLAGLIRVMACTAPLLAGVQTLSACLTGQGKAKIAAISMTAGVAVKLGLEAWLLRYPQISVFGAAYAAIGCYVVAILVDLYYNIRERKNRWLVGWDALRFAAMAAAAVAAAYPLRGAHVLLILAVCAAVYLALGFVLRAFTAEELRFAWRKKHDHHCRVGVQPR